MSAYLRQNIDYLSAGNPDGLWGSGFAAKGALKEPRKQTETDHDHLPQLPAANPAWGRFRREPSLLDKPTMITVMDAPSPAAHACVRGAPMHRCTCRRHRRFAIPAPLILGIWHPRKDGSCNGAGRLGKSEAFERRARKPHRARRIVTYADDESCGYFGMYP